ncbi:MAG: Holliday junction branch migration protein RuvA [Oscillospiraceae bacterium]|jgi:Holliday junction DNA helicase RuvA|nr:Holliday junction branch migration protein RuvA [Oscillospiraceae bacterium]
MFYSIKGKLTHMEQGITVIECGGVGFKCLTSRATQGNLPPIGEEAMLYTHLNVREDALDLFGFSSKSELNCFKLLTSVSGVGPKAGLAILSELSPEHLAIAIAAGDTKAVSRAQGVGAKIAQRIIVELKDKLSLGFSPDGSTAGASQMGVISAASNVQEAVNALSVLGYQPSDAMRLVAQFDSNLPVEELIRLSLKSMGGQR